MLKILNPQVIDQVETLARQFAPREPFRHVVIDDFLAADFCARLLAQFPPFERGNARNEAGVLGNKATIEQIRRLGPAFARLDDAMQSAEFLEFVGRITSIDDLLYDPDYFGGGTHDNRSGQELDAHVDFNRHPGERWHRRLNLIVYLNHAWEPAWGGDLELHSDPRSADDRIIRIAPLFNRAVIFETTENSWHGFRRIALPPERQAQTRKSVALYFYTRERPADELAPTHSTIYVDQPLPAHLGAGYRLEQADIDEIGTLYERRAQHIERLYADITRLTGEVEEAQRAIFAGRLGRLRYFLLQLRRRLRALRD